MSVSTVSLSDINIQGQPPEEEEGRDLLGTDLMCDNIANIQNAGTFYC